MADEQGGTDGKPGLGEYPGQAAGKGPAGEQAGAGFATPSSGPSTLANAPGNASNGSSPATEALPSTQLDYQALFQQISGNPCRVAQLTMVHEEEGTPLRTKPHIIDRELERVHRAATLEELHTALEETGRALQQLGVFSRVDMLVNEEPEDDPEACTVLMDLREKNWYRVHTGTYFQGGENTVELGLGLHNATGHAEHLSIAAEAGTQLSSHFTLTYDQPRPYGLPLQAELRANLHRRNHLKASSFVEALRGVVLGVRSLDGRHHLQYDLGWRSIMVDVVKSGASPAVAAQAGDFLKASARYAWFLDRRDHPGNPASGWAIKSTTEVAGLGSDQALRYAKQQLDAQVLVPLVRGVVLNLAASGGIMLPWGGAAPLQRTTCIADRFFLGGPATLRGFKYQGVGPTSRRRPPRGVPVSLDDVPSTSTSGREEGGEDGPDGRRDALGGDLYASVLAEVTFALPLPALKSLGLQGHVFANGGGCELLAGPGQSRDGVVNTLRGWWGQWRWSTGVGIVLPTFFGRFEANYVHVLAFQEHDRVKRGLQLGFASSVFA